MPSRPDRSRMGLRLVYQTATKTHITSALLFCELLTSGMQSASGTIAVAISDQHQGCRRQRLASDDVLVGLDSASVAYNTVCPYHASEVDHSSCAAENRNAQRSCCCLDVGVSLQGKRTLCRQSVVSVLGRFDSDTRCSLAAEEKRTMKALYLGNDSKTPHFAETEAAPILWHKSGRLF